MPLTDWERFYTGTIVANVHRTDHRVTICLPGLEQTIPGTEARQLAYAILHAVPEETPETIRDV
jgi:hypothetical protein